jgi:hypothetical protein
MSERSEPGAPAGSSLIICFISSSKPISRIRSASSMTNALRFLNTKPLVFCSGQLSVRNTP